MNRIHLSARFFATTFMVGITFLVAPSASFAYSQPYYQSYYQPYYQSQYSKTVTVPTGTVGGVTVVGTITKGSGTFVIDDPTDPKNTLLYHSFVESPDVKNIYDGIATLDQNGEAIIVLPRYFDALNGDVRYQVKPIGASMPNLYIKEEEHNNQFTVAGGAPGKKVSWQITGIRHDPYIEANPIIPEVDKGPGQIVDKGEYVYPEGFEHHFPLSQFIARLLAAIGLS